MRNFGNRLRPFWKPLLVVALGLLVWRLLPDSVVTTEPKSGGDYSTERGVTPPRERTPVAASAPALEPGERFASLEALLAAQQARGYLRIGLFGGSWPAMVTEVLNGNDAISFTKKDGSRHNYQGFDGYRLQMVRLSGSGQEETLVVFRSQNRR